MSILINGMKMPPLYKTYKVRFAETNGGKIVVGIANEDSTAYTPVGEVVPVPPHGRLIDADALIELIGFEVRHYVVKDEFDKGRVAAWNNVIRAIREYVPTIIPAEEDE